MIFLKPWSTLIHSPNKLSLPSSISQQVIHEVELGVMIGKTGKNIQKSEAMSYIHGYFLALDMTNLDLFKQLSKNGLSPSLCKTEDNFTPVSYLFHHKVNPYEIELSLKVNG